jgi:hypothetical protein
MQPPTRPGSTTPSGIGGEGGSNPLADLNAAAPIPPRPRLFPANSKYFTVPIVFEVELIAPAPAASASASAQGGDL